MLLSIKRAPNRDNSLPDHDPVETQEWVWHGQTHFLCMAGGKGVEPLFTESESVVLPLNDPPFFVSVPVPREP